MKISLIDDEREFLKLGEGWNRLLERSASRSLFLTWEWVEAWWKNYRQNGDRLFVLLAEEDDELIGIAPLYLRRIKFLRLFNLRALFFLGDGSWDSDYLDFIVAAGREGEVINEFFRCLGRLDDWDLALLNEIPESSPNLAHIADCSRRSNLTFRASEVACGYTPLPDNWPSYLASLKPRFRTKVRSSLKRLEEEPQARFERCSDYGSLVSTLAALFELHGKRWALRHQQGVFVFPGKKAFYMDIARAFLKKEMLRLYSLRLGDKVVACQIGFEYNNALYHLQEGFDPEYESLSVGIALRAYVFRECIARGLREYDFLGGIGRHKTDWGAVPKKSARLALARRRLGSSLYVELPSLLEEYKEPIKRFVPQPLLELKRQLAERARVRQFKPSAQPEPEARPSLDPKGMLLKLSTGALFYSGMGSALHLLANKFSYRNSTPARPLIAKRAWPVYPVLIYHRVSDDNDPFFPSVPVKVFEEQVKYLSRRFTVLPLEEILELAESGKLPKDALAITFDDGYRDNYLNALPILEKYSVPAAVFVATGCIETKHALWFNRLSWAFKQTREPGVELELHKPMCFLLKTEAQRLRALNQVTAVLRNVEEEKRLAWTEQILGRLKVHEEGWLSQLMLTWDQIRHMRGRGISFGSHTVTHPVLSQLSEDRAEEEIYRSKQELEARLGEPVSLFAYPFGKRGDINQNVKHLVRRAGYSCALTTIFGPNLANEDRYELRRGQPWETHLPTFAIKLEWYRFSLT